MAEEGVWLTLDEAARHAGLSPGKLKAPIKSGDIPSEFNRKKWRRRVHKRTLDFWIEQQRIRPGSLAHLDSNRWLKYRQ